MTQSSTGVDLVLHSTGFEQASKLSTASSKYYLSYGAICLPVLGPPTAEKRMSTPDCSIRTYALSSILRASIHRVRNAAGCHPYVAGPQAASYRPGQGRLRRIGHGGRDRPHLQRTMPQAMKRAQLTPQNSGRSTTTLPCHAACNRRMSTSCNTALNHSADDGQARPNPGQKRTATAN